MLNIKKGNIKNEIIVHNYEKVSNGINRKYRVRIDSIIKRKIQSIKIKDEDFIDFITERMLLTINKKGRIDDLKLLDYKKEEMFDYFSKKAYNTYRNKLLKLLKNLQFDILKRKGKPVKEEVYLKLYYSDIE